MPPKEQKFRLALAQVSASENKRENIDKALDLIKAAADARASMLILPELFMVYVTLDSPPQKLSQDAEDLSGPFVKALAGEAKRSSIHVVAGMLEKSAKPDKVHNTVVMIGPDGKLISTHRKLQLFDSFGYMESSRFEPAEDLEGVFSTKLGTMGMMTCYELRFPEIARILASRGAELIIVPTAWVAGRMKEEHLHVLAKARALENTVFLAVASQTGRIFTGRSVVVDPFGVSICDAGESECLVTVEIDLGRVQQVRKTLPNLAQTRTDIYRKYWQASS
jgi:deaminated glutathione amidase